MSRINYSEDESYPGQFNLWRANVNRSIAGRRGRAALLDLESALIAMSSKRLIGQKFIDGDEVCAVGALVVTRLAATGRPEAEVKAQLAADHTYCDRCNHQQSAHLDGQCTSCAKRDVALAAFYEMYPSHRDEMCTAFVASETSVDDDEEGDTEAEAIKVGVPDLVAWRLVELNDIELARDTPEERYAHVLQWVQQQLKMPLAEQQRQDMT